MANIEMRRFDVKLSGTTPMLMHYDNIEWADRMAAWRAVPENKKNSKAGDDRTPAFTWIGSLYNDGANVALPQDMMMSCLMKAGAMVPVPGGKGGKTFKAQTQSGMMLATPFWRFEIEGQQVPMSAINPLIEERSFAAHCDAARALGFDLYVKRAAIGKQKHVRVRPRFDRWDAIGQIVVWDEQLTPEALSDIFRFAGQYKGLGDWRPGGRTPGPWGMFEAEIVTTH